MDDTPEPEPTTPARYCLFPTAIGRCAIAWRGDVVVATQLPEESDASTVERLAARAGGAAAAGPSPDMQRAIDAISSLLAGSRADLAFIACDFAALEPFNADVYRIARTIAPGATLTYGDVALKLGGKHLSQAVGRALGRNPFPIIVPCHRVVGANGRLTGFSANGGIVTKLRLLEIEGISLGAAGGLFDDLPIAVAPSARRPRGNGR